MNLKRSYLQARTLRNGVAAIVIATLAACSSHEKPKLGKLPVNAASLAVRQVWAVRIPATSFPLQANTRDHIVTLAGADGTVLAIDASSGAERWRVNVGVSLSTGAGSDGSLAAVVTQKNELMGLQDGKVLWKQRLTAQTYTAPLVAGRRVFVQAADRTVSAWDGQTGRRLWALPRTAENLVLKKPGVLMAVGDTLITGIGGRLVALNPANGSPRWESPVAALRGTNDIERMVDLTGPASRWGESLCVRAYGANVGCLDTVRGQVSWTKPAVGAEGLGGDDRFVYGTETNGDVVAWRRGDGERAWLSERLKHRRLTAPLAMGRALVIGEDDGMLYFVSREDGSLLNRITPDGSAIATAPVAVGNLVVVATRNGGLFGYRLEQDGQTP